MKFHLTAIITNLMIIFGILYLYSFILTSVDEAYFAKKGYYSRLCFAYFTFVFSWASTFIIYKIKNQSTHLYYFLCFNILSAFIYILFINYHPFDLSNLINSLKSAIVETAIPIVAISICVSISQNFIGKRLLPTRYC